MKNILMLSIAIFSLHTSCSSKKETEQRQINIKETYCFLNYLFYLHDSIGHSNVLYVAEHDPDYDHITNSEAETFFKELATADESFKNTDEEFVITQLARMRSFKLDQKFLNGRKVIPYEEIKRYKESGYENLWAHLKYKYNCEIYNSVSLPVFSKDYSSAVVASQYFSVHSGGGVIWLFKKVNNKWVYTKQLSFWDT